MKIKTVKVILESIKNPLVIVRQLIRNVKYAGNSKHYPVCNQNSRKIREAGVVAAYFVAAQFEGRNRSFERRCHDIGYPLYLAIIYKANREWLAAMMGMFRREHSGECKYDHRKTPLTICLGNS